MRVTLTSVAKANPISLQVAGSIWSRDHYLYRCSDPYRARPTSLRLRQLRATVAATVSFRWVVAVKPTGTGSSAGAQTSGKVGTHQGVTLARATGEQRTLTLGNVHEISDCGDGFKHRVDCVSI